MTSPAVIDFIRARLGNIKICATGLTVVTHNGLRGRFREILAQDLLAPYLPPQIELLSGVIVGANNEQRDVRNEDDIVLFDHSVVAAVEINRLAVQQAPVGLIFA